jgi:hypothetical protein
VSLAFLLNAPLLTVDRLWSGTLSSFLLLLLSIYLVDQTANKDKSTQNLYVHKLHTVHCTEDVHIRVRGEKF